MLNPFEEESSELSIQHAAFPVCFMQSDPFHDLHSASPISLLDLDRLSEQLSHQQANDEELKNNTKQLHKMLKQMKMYAESLEQRNLEIVCDLQKERTRNKQLLSAFTFLKTTEDQKSKSIEERVVHSSQISAKYEVERNKREMVEAEVKTLRLQNSYLKELILIANNNYQKLQQKNKQILDRCSTLEQQNNKREVEMMKKTQEIKSMFTAIVIDKNNGDGKEQHLKVKSENIPNANNTINSNNFKSVRKEQTDEAYRTLFLKTLKGKKQNTFKQV